MEQLDVGDGSEKAPYVLLIVQARKPKANKTPTSFYIRELISTPLIYTTVTMSP